MQTAADELIQRGFAQGEAKGKAAAILAVLAGRRVPVTDSERQRVLACTDHAALDAWLEVAATCTAASTRYTH